MGQQLGQGVRNFAEYQRIRQGWRENIAAAERKLKECGGCASARQELREARAVENRFQEVAGRLAATARMSPAMARLLDIGLPLSAGRSEEERVRQCTLVRKEWQEALPDFCQETVDAYLNCVKGYQREHGLCAWKGAVQPGAQCWQLRKLRDLCAAGDFAGFHARQAIQEARRQGEIIPELVEGPHTNVLYGRVPAGFEPELPPADVLLEELAQDSVIAISFKMDKTEPDSLDEITVRDFHFSLVDAYSRCFDAGDPAGQIERRVCADFDDMNWLYEERTVLVCSYVGERENRPMPTHIFWYAKRPGLADGKNLLRRSHSHPLLRIGEPRLECPADLNAANRLLQDRQRALAKLRTREPQVPAGEQIPRPEWQQQLVTERQDRHKARQARLKARHEAMETFPVEGVYNARLIGERTSERRCTIAQVGSGRKFGVMCRDDDGSLSVTSARVISGNLSVAWPEGTVGYLVDLDRASNERPALSGNALHADLKGTLVRLSDLPPLSDLPGEGTYQLVLATSGTEQKLSCRMTRDQAYDPPRYLIACKDTRGREVSNEGRSNHRSATAIKFGPWYPESPAMAARDLNDYGFLIDPDHPENLNDRVVLAGFPIRSFRGSPIRATLIATDPAAGLISADEQTKPTDEPVTRRGADVQPPPSNAARDEATSKTMPTRAAVDRRPVATPTCTADDIAGSYRSGYGVLACKAREDALRCCYASGCRKWLDLEVDARAAQLTGRWEYQSGATGPAVFGLTPDCELTDGAWGMDLGAAPTRRWRVSGRE